MRSPSIDQNSEIFVIIQVDSGFLKLIKKDVKVVDLTVTREYSPKIRTNGLALPGIKVGWFKLKNGEKALLFVTDMSHVVYIPSRKGYSVLLSVAYPAEFIAKINEFW